MATPFPPKRESEVEASIARHRSALSNSTLYHPATGADRCTRCQLNDIIPCYQPILGGPWSEIGCRSTKTCFGCRARKVSCSLISIQTSTNFGPSASNKAPTSLKSKSGGAFPSGSTTRSLRSTIRPTPHVAPTENSDEQSGSVYKPSDDEEDLYEGRASLIAGNHRRTPQYRPATSLVPDPIVRSSAPSSRRSASPAPELASEPIHLRTSTYHPVLTSSHLTPNSSQTTGCTTTSIRLNAIEARLAISEQQISDLKTDFDSLRDVVAEQAAAVAELTARFRTRQYQ